MFRLIGVLLLMAGSIGIGWSVKERLKKNLEDLYRMKQILHMLQNEIEYSRAPLPEACARVGNRVPEPYRSAFFSIRREMLVNDGRSFWEIWSRQMEECMKELSVAREDKTNFLDFGNCIGFMDGKMQAGAVGQYMHKLDISIGRMEKEMADKCKVIMSLSIMGGLMLVIILL